jgi:hypothetical protein
MVLCFIALPILAILGIFSATHRQLAKEAFRCVFLKLQFKPCETRLDTKLKTAIVSGFLKRNKAIGKFVQKHFTALSIIFVILMLASTYYVIDGGINYYKYGNCAGPGATGFCIFDPLGSYGGFSTIGTAECLLHEPDETWLYPEKFNESLFAIKDGTGPTLVFIGCFSCDYTRETAENIFSAVRKHDARLVFAHIPLHEEEKVSAKYTNCLYQENPEKYWEFVEFMFSVDKTQINNETYLQELTGITTCADNDLINEQIDNLIEVGIYGTPTVFVGDQVAVGPKPQRVYERMIRRG